MNCTSKRKVRCKVFTPKFVKDYADQASQKLCAEKPELKINLATITFRAFQEYIKEVKEEVFPAEEHCYKMKNPEEFEKLRKKISQLIRP